MSTSFSAEKGSIFVGKRKTGVSLEIKKDAVPGGRASVDVERV
jgi:hypothetical protein